MNDELAQNLFFIGVVLYAITYILKQEYADTEIKRKFDILVDKIATCVLVIGIVTKVILNLW